MFRWLLPETTQDEEVEDNFGNGFSAPTQKQLWNLFENPHHSKAAKVIAVILYILLHFCDSSFYVFLFYFLWVLAIPGSIVFIVCKCVCIGQYTPDTKLVPAQAKNMFSLVSQTSSYCFCRWNNPETFLPASGDQYLTSNHLPLSNHRKVPVLSESWQNFIFFHSVSSALTFWKSIIGLIHCPS